MSKLQQATESAISQMKSCKIPVNKDLIAAICKGLGPGLYKKDARFVAARDKQELAKIRKNFIAKKLGETDEKKQDAAIAHAIEKIGPSNRAKQRAVFYYLIVRRLKKTSVYG